MKVVVTSQGTDLASPVDPRFGRAAQFILVDSETGHHEVYANQQALDAAQGAGIQAARVVVDLGAEAVITGNVGPKAFMALEAGRVAVYIGATGTVEEALGELKQGTLRLADGANVDGHWT